MSDLQFIKFLKEINANKNLELKDINEMIVERFPDGVQKKAKNHLRNLVSSKMKDVDKKNLDNTLIQLDPIYKRLYSNAATLDTYYSKDIRNIIKKRFGLKSPEHLASLKLTKLAGTIKGNLIRRQKENLVEKHGDQKEFESNVVKQYIMDNIDNEDPFYRAVACLLACGARPIEFFDEEINFEIIDEHWVIQDFLAKKRGKVQSVKKPIVFISSKKFNETRGDVLWELKKEHKKLFNRSKSGEKELASKIETRSNKVAKDIFGHADKFTLYSCRKIYAQVSYQEFARNSIYGVNPTIQLWTSKVLGHSDNDLNTQNHYSHFKVTQPTVSPAEVVSKIENLTIQVDNLEQRLETENVPKAVPVTNERLTFTDKKIKKQFDTIKKVYEENKDLNLTQTKLEVLLKGIIPRSVVRLWYQKNIKSAQ